MGLKGQKWCPMQCQPVSPPRNPFCAHFKPSPRLRFLNLKTSDICKTISEIWKLISFQQEHQVSYRCSLTLPLQGRSKDWEDLKVLSFWIFLDWRQEVSQISEKLLSKVKENLQNFHVIFCNPWISSAMAMSMSIYRTIGVLVCLRLIAYKLAQQFLNVNEQ